MTARPPEGPKADFDAEGASASTVPRPPSASALDEVSKDQGMITDEWTGEPATGEQKTGEPDPDAPPAGPPAGRPSPQP